MKKMTTEQLQKQLDELQKAYNEKLKKEREQIGAAVQAATGLNSSKEIFKHFTLVKKGVVENEQ